MYSYDNYPYNANYSGLNNYNQNDERFAGILAPLFLGGVAGYAIGYNRPNNYQYPMPMPYQVPVYTNNYYYPY